MTGTFVKAGKAGDFKEGQAAGVRVNDRDICVVRLNNEFFAFDDRCTHAESQLSMGEVEDGEIVCPLHGARFSVKTGEALTLPAVKPVKTYETKVEGEELLIKL